MFESGPGDLVLRRVWSHRTHRSRMSSTSLRSTPSCGLSSLQIHRLKVLVEVGLVAFSCACFKLVDEVPKEAQHGSLVHLLILFSGRLHGLSKVAVVGICA